MNNAGSDGQGISRRRVLCGTALALGAVTADAAMSHTSAQQKIAQAVIGYQNTPKGDQHCGVCFNFQPPDACKFVDGSISPNGWCQLFAAKS